MSYFEKKLKELNFNSNRYLRLAKLKAEEYGLNPKLLKYSDKEDSKLMYDKTAYFGHPEYSDYIIYTMLEENKLVPTGYADIRRDAYLKRATKIKGNWKDNKLSANNLAINILW